MTWLNGLKIKAWQETVFPSRNPFIFKYFNIFLFYSGMKPRSFEAFLRKREREENTPLSACF